MKNRNLITLAILISLLPASSLYASQAIYKSVGHQTLYGNGRVTQVTARGFWVFDPDTGRGTAVGGLTLDGRKLFTVVPLQNYRIEHVAGPNSTTYTIIAKAESPGTQYAGILLEAVYLRGRDTLVQIDSNGTRSLPRTFTSSARAISQSTQNGAAVANEVTGSYTLDLRASQASNASETFDAAVTRFANYFLSQGYTQFTAPPAQ